MCLVQGSSVFFSIIHCSALDVCICLISFSRSCVYVYCVSVCE